VRGLTVPLLLGIVFFLAAVLTFEGQARCPASVDCSDNPPCENDAGCLWGCSCSGGRCVP
jgi:hypothetical protein